MSVFHATIKYIFCVLISLFQVNTYAKQNEYILTKKEQQILRSNLFSLNYYSLINGSSIPIAKDRYLVVNANKLQEDYKIEPNLFDKKYFKQFLIVYGKIHSINIRENNLIYIEFKDEQNVNYNLKAYFKEGNNDYLKSFTISESIPIICEKWTSASKEISLNNCYSPNSLLEEQVNQEMTAAKKINNSTKWNVFVQQSIAMSMNKFLSKKSLCYKDVLSKEYAQYCTFDNVEIIRNKKSELKKSKKEIGVLLNKFNIDVKKIYEQK